MIYQQNHKMKKYYYEIWADAIGFEKAKHGHIRNWKPYVLIGITFCQGLNLGTILIVLGTWVKSSFFLSIDFFPGEMLDGALSGIITLFVPFLILNYLLIFRKKKYEGIIENYPYRKGKRYIGYFIVSVVLLLLPILIGFFSSRF